MKGVHRFGPGWIEALFAGTCEPILGHGQKPFAAPPLDAGRTEVLAEVDDIDTLAIGSKTVERGNW